MNKHKSKWLELGFMISLAVMISSGIAWVITEYKDEDDIDYSNRFYKQSLSDFFLVQLYMFPFNDNDTVTMFFEGEHDEIIHIVHTEPNPDYAYIGKYVYEYKFHFDHELSVEEVK